MTQPAGRVPRLLKPLRRPRLWLGLWLAAVLAVIVVCLLPAQELPHSPAGVDKLEHLAAFALLAAAAVQLFAGGRTLVVVALALVGLGAAIELAQGSFTATRSMDPYDALADALGVLLGMASAWTPWRDGLLRLEPRRARR